ncbi:MAG: HIT domain-containing protein, partial [Bdellovibrionales bacterium]|nr:HIT domain-containing protein [Bdellovibrionales bacterium]
MKANQLEFLKDVWPQERDFLERPDRLKYVRKIVRPKGCVFCSAAKAGVSFESLVLFKKKGTLVVLNKYPYNTGHLLVLPLQHCGDLTKLSSAKSQKVSEMVRLAAQILLKTYGCPGLNIGLNHGTAGGAGIPNHLHWHIVPRWVGDTNFFPVLA